MFIYYVFWTLTVIFYNHTIVISIITFIVIIIISHYLISSFRGLHLVGACSAVTCDQAYFSLDRREKVHLMQFLNELSVAYLSRVMFPCVML